ncbi:class I SAM-dependent methyltransferase [Polaromonas sp.]|uniref:class I SAM-dependent methyltransferase n=1 Tax=Polaromonas sp. TaxID=1869339 RepID=UPI003BAC7C9D
MTQKDQTFSSFRDKWENNTQLAFSETLNEKSDIFGWIMSRNGFAAKEEFQAFLAGKGRVLDAGCGNGRVTALLHALSTAPTQIVGVDLTAAHVAAENLKSLDRVTIQQGDLLGDLSGLGKFDFIYCQEVLHHTADPKGGFLNLTRRLNNSGEIAIYVYKVKAPIREYADDYVREKISGLPYEEAMRLMQQVTDFGKALTELNVKVTVPEVEVLKIPAGEYDVQRLLYHFFLKCFWNGAMTHQENVAINYDWYHPQLCTRHTMPEVKGWFEEAGLVVKQECEDFYGITVRGQRAA